MKKFLPICLLLILALCACNRKEFTKKLTGTWTISHYLYANQDETPNFTDTSHVKFQFVINEDQRYNFSWTTYTYISDTTLAFDTTGHDTITNIYTIDTVRNITVNKTVTPYNQGGAWILINSEEDIQLTPDSDQNNPLQYQILKLSGNTLNLKGGLVEYDMTK